MPVMLRPIFIRVKLVRSIRESTWECDFGHKTRRLHNVFHVSSFREYHRTRKQAGGTLGSALDKDGRVVTPAEAEKMIQREAETENQEYEVESVLRHRRRGKKVEYLCSWRHFPLSHSSWIKEGDLNAPRLVKEYALALVGTPRKVDVPIGSSSS